MIDWKPIETLVERREVLLCWTWPEVEGVEPLVRIGSLFSKGFSDIGSTYKIAVEVGDASALLFTNRDDEQPTHWADINLPVKP